jgi:hypothetical protein
MPMPANKRLWTLLFTCELICGQAAGPQEGRTPRKGEAKQVRKERTATRGVPSDFGDATLWLDPLKWVEYSRETGVVRFNHVNKHVLGWMLADKTGGIRTSAMKELALRNSLREDPNARIDREERRVVNGREVLYLEIILSHGATPIRFAGYYHGGLKSNLQVVAYCVESDFDAYQKDVNEFISGIEIREASSPEQ